MLKCVFHRFRFPKSAFAALTNGHIREATRLRALEADMYPPSPKSNVSLGRFLLGAVLWSMFGLPSAYLLWLAYNTGTIWTGGKFTGFRWVDSSSSLQEFNWAVRMHGAVVTLCYGGLISIFIKRLSR